jgi:hypothetical protein
MPGSLLFSLCNDEEVSFPVSWTKLRSENRAHYSAGQLGARSLRTLDLPACEESERHMKREFGQNYCLKTAGYGTGLVMGQKGDQRSHMRRHVWHNSRNEDVLHHTTDLSV